MQARVSIFIHLLNLLLFISHVSIPMAAWECDSRNNHHAGDIPTRVSPYLLIGLVVNSVGAGYERYLDGRSNVIVGGFMDGTGLTDFSEGLQSGNLMQAGFGVLEVTASVAGLRQGFGLIRGGWGLMPASVRGALGTQTILRPALYAGGAGLGLYMFAGGGTAEAEGASVVRAARVLRGVLKAVELQRNALGQFTRTAGEILTPGSLRQARGTAKLRKQYPGARIIEEAYLRDAAGKIVRHPIAGARQLDQVVVRGSRVLGVFETTSMRASKTAQLDRDFMIRQFGGIFILDTKTGRLLKVQATPTQLLRLP